MDCPNMSQLPTIETLDCDGDPTSLGHRWQRWKRALEIYLLALGIDQPLKKRATLLHTGGLALQDIYYNLPGAHVQEADSPDVFESAIKKLDDYFSPKQSFVYERHVFRLLKQEPDEKFEKFLVRLRNQCSKCDFALKDNALIDQIAEKCTSSDLRKKILQLGDSVTIEKVILEANSIETIERQLKEFQVIKTEQVNRIGTRTNKTRPQGTRTDNNRCTRCGSENHKCDDTRCPAKDKAYNYKVVYYPGKNNIADSLSRLCPNHNSDSHDDEHHINKIVEFARPMAVAMEDIVDKSKSDEDIQLVKSALSGNNWDPKVNNYKLFEHELWLHGDILLRGNKIIIPTVLRKQVLASAHEGHPGIVATKSRLRTKVWWPKIDKDAENMVKSCKSCTLVSGPSLPVPMKRHKIPSAVDVENRRMDLEVYDKDKTAKEKGKFIEDRKRKAVNNEINIGEKVYVKNMIKENKLTPDFSPTPHTVMSAKGGDLNIQNDETGQSLRRNIVHLKKVEGQWRIHNENGKKEDGNDEIDTDE
uniref:RNA-directed DNA polymerase n=1 Tax=Spodoptera frugiperda TaxID=7108 RepID=A0A2H1VFE7_SPOFR